MNKRRGLRQSPQDEPLLPEEARAVAVLALKPLGTQRIEASRALAALDDKIRPLVLSAVHAGVTYRRIAELTGIPRATIGRWALEANSLSGKENAR